MLSLLINIAATFAPVSNIFRSPFTHYKHFIRNKFYTCTWYMVCWYKKIFLVHVQYYWKITRKETYCNYNSISKLVLDSWFIFKCTDVMYNSTIIILIIRKKTIPKKKWLKSITTCYIHVLISPTLLVYRTNEKFCHESVEMWEKIIKVKYIYLYYMNKCNFKQMQIGYGGHKGLLNS